MPPTIQHIIDTLLLSVAETLPMDSSGSHYIALGDETAPLPLPNTVDTVKCGNPSLPVTSIVTTFMATYEVIKAAAAQGANLIITHEPTFYNHTDETAWLQDDPVYQTKRDLLDQTGIVVWRFHDHIHIRHPDGIMTGFAKRLGWESYEVEHKGIFDIPDLSLADLVKFLKGRLGLPILRLVGDPGMKCRRVAAFLGYSGGDWQIKSYSLTGADTVIVGETIEWQACEYVRDAVASGIPRALIVLGHEKSEEPGMLYLVEWLHELFPGVPVTHIPAGDPLQFI